MAKLTMGERPARLDLGLDLGRDLGSYLREQREAAELSLRQLADLAGISNPYLSQIERGLRRPSAEILGALATGLRISAESLYVRAGLLVEPPHPAHESTHEAAAPARTGVREALRSDPALSPRQRGALLDLYDLFTTDRLVSEGDSSRPAAARPSASDGDQIPAATRRRSTRSSGARTPTGTTRRSNDVTEEQHQERREGPQGRQEGRRGRASAR